jgi:hypothetical protein
MFAVPAIWAVAPAANKSAATEHKNPRRAIARLIDVDVACMEPPKLVGF